MCYLIFFTIGTCTHTFLKKLKLHIEKQDPNYVTIGVPTSVSSCNFQGAYIWIKRMIMEDFSVSLLLEHLPKFLCLWKDEGHLVDKFSFEKSSVISIPLSSGSYTNVQLSEFIALPTIAPISTHNRTFIHFSPSSVFPSYAIAFRRIPFAISVFLPPFFVLQTAKPWMVTQGTFQYLTLGQDSQSASQPETAVRTSLNLQVT